MDWGNEPCCSHCDAIAKERESKLADQCMIQHDMIKAQAELIDELIDELREELREKASIADKRKVLAELYACLPHY